MVVTREISLPFIDSLKKWTICLKQDHFLQIQKSFIINIDHIEKLTGDFLYVRKQKTLVGKIYKGALFKMVKPINQLNKSKLNIVVFLMCKYFYYR